MKLTGILLFLILIGCSVVDVRPLGTVEGKVSIDPLCGYAPNPTDKNPCGLTDEQLDGVYGKYTVVLSSVSKPSSSTVLRKKLDRTGLFLFEVEEGEYLLNLESSQQNALMFSDKASIEKTIKISSSQKLFVELNVNTGIPSR